MSWRRRVQFLLPALLLATVAVAQTDPAPALRDLKGQTTSLAAYKG
jgi:hypothetical protein